MLVFVLLTFSHCYESKIFTPIFKLEFIIINYITVYGPKIMKFLSGLLDV
jgi:hypothetical protein